MTPSIAEIAFMILAVNRSFHLNEQLDSKEKIHCSHLQRGIMQFKELKSLERKGELNGKRSLDIISDHEWKH
jgi:hypothetical protein